MTRRAATPKSDLSESRIASVAADLQRWIESQHFVGWDPYDALAWKPLALLAEHGLIPHPLAQVAVQVGVRSRWNARSVLRVPKLANAKAFALLLQAYVLQHRSTKSPRDAHSIADMVERLRGEAIPVGNGSFGWGYPFAWPNRYFFAPAYTPNAVVTSFVTRALLDAHEEIGSSSALNLAAAGGRFLAAGLNVLRNDDGICFSYTPRDRRWVHNANVLVASSLGRLGHTLDRDDWLELALDAARFTVAKQQPDGSWWYGTLPKDRWIDSFHTAYVVDGLRVLGSALGEPVLQTAAARGYSFWRDNLISEDGVAFATVGSPYPVDTHAVAQGILTLLEHGEIEMAIRATDWADRFLRRPTGWFVFRLTPGRRVDIPYMRWSQAWMLYALRKLQFEMSRRGA